MKFKKSKIKFCDLYCCKNIIQNNTKLLCKPQPSNTFENQEKYQIKKYFTEFETRVLFLIKKKESGK